MTNIWKRSLSLVLALVMVIGMVPFQAFAAEGEETPEDPQQEIVEGQPEVDEPEQPAEDEEENNEEDVEKGVAELPFVGTSTTFAEPVPQAETPEGTIWVNRGNLSGSFTEILRNGGIPKAVCDAVGVTYKPSDTIVTYQGENTGDQNFIVNKAEVLMDEVKANGYANFRIISTLEGTQDVKIYFEDTRLIATFHTPNGTTVTPLENEEPQDLDAMLQWVKTWAAANVTITGDDPQTEAVESTPVDLNAATLSVVSADTAWPADGEEKTLTFRLGFGSEDNTVCQKKSVDLTLVIRDTTSVYVVTYVDQNDNVLQTFELKVQPGEKPVTPALTAAYPCPDGKDPTGQNYKLVWTPAIEKFVTESVTYKGKWIPNEDNNRNGIADQCETYDVSFTIVGKAGWGDTESLVLDDFAYGTSMSDVLEEFDQEYQEEYGLNLTNPGSMCGENEYFLGFFPELPTVIKAPKEQGQTILNFEARFTQDWIVTFKGPNGQTTTAAVKNGHTLATLPVHNFWEGYCITGWKYSDGTDFVQATPIEGALELTAVYIEDRNDNCIKDGSADDPFTYYDWIAKYEGDDTTTFLHTADWLTGEPAIDVSSYTYTDLPNDGYTFEYWTEDFNQAENTYTYTAIISKDSNNNDIPDYGETIKVDVTGEGTGSVKVGQEVVTGEYVYDSNNPQTITVTADADSFIKSIDITIDGVKPELALTPGENEFTYTLGRGERNNKVLVEVSFGKAESIELKPDGERTLEAHEAAYTEAEVFGAAVVDGYPFNEFFTVKYIAREAKTYQVNVKPVWEAIKNDSVLGQFASQVEDQYKDIAPNDLYAYTYENDALLSVSNALVSEKTEAEIADGIIAAMNERLAELAGLALDIKNATDAGEDADAKKQELKDIIQEIFDDEMRDANFHKFGHKIVNGNLEDVEKIVIIYKNGNQLSTWNTDVTLDRSHQLATTITARNVTVTFGKFSDEDVFNAANATLKTENGVVDGNITMEGTYAGKDAGTYEVKLKFAGNDNYLPSETTFQLTIKPVTATLEMDKNVVVQYGNDYSIAPTIKVDDVAVTNIDYIQMIAGIDLAGANFEVDGDGTFKETLTLKAWIRMPDLYQDVAKQVLDKSSYTLDELQSKLSELSSKLDFNASDLDAIFNKVKSLNETAGKFGITLNENVRIFLNNAAQPVNIGAYINYVTLFDNNCSNQATAQGVLVIGPAKTAPNRGVDLVHGEESKNVFTFENGAFNGLRVKKDGNIVSDATIYYYGFCMKDIVGENNDIYAKTIAPEKPGIYVASVAYNDGDDLLTDAAVVIIGLQNTTIKVDNLTVTEDGSGHTVPVTVDEGVGYTLISGEVDAGSGEFKASLNIDFPLAVDNLLAKKGWSYPQDVTAAQAAAALQTRLNTVKDDLIPSVKDKLPVTSDSINNALDKLTNGIQTVINQLQKIADNDTAGKLIVTFNHGQTYTNPGVYGYLGIITDPEYNPAVDYGWMIVETSKAFEMTETKRPFNGQEQFIDMEDETGRGFITLIIGDEFATLEIGDKLDQVMSSELYNTIKQKVEELTGQQLPADVPVRVTTGELKDKYNQFADAVSNAIVNQTGKSARSLLNKLFSGVLSEELIESAANKLESSLSKAFDKGITTFRDKLNSFMWRPDDYTIYVNGPRPVKVGKYEFHGISYAVGYTTADLTIETNNITITAVDQTIELGATPDLKKYTVTDSKDQTVDYYTGTVTLKVMDGETEVTDFANLAAGVYDIVVDAENVDGFIITPVNGKLTVEAAECPFDMGQTMQIRLIEPWALRANLKIYFKNEDGSRGNRMTAEEVEANIDNYGVYFVRESELEEKLGLEDATQDNVTVEDIINHSNVTHYNKASRKVQYQNAVNGLSCDFDKGIYTYELSDAVFVLYYLEVDGQTYYAPILERNISEFVNKYKDRPDVFPDGLERDLYAKLAQMEYDTVAYRSQWTNPQPIPMMDAPTTAQYPLGTPAEHSIVFKHTSAVALIEPWGMKFNGLIPDDKEYDDYGIVVFYDMTGKYETAPGVEELIAEPEAYVFSVSNGDATLTDNGDGRNKVTAVYNNGLYTYHMTRNAYFVVYVVNEGDYCYGTVQTRSIKSTIEGALDPSELQKNVLDSMVALYESVKVYRASKGYNDI